MSKQIHEYEVCATATLSACATVFSDREMEFGDYDEEGFSTWIEWDRVDPSEDFQKCHYTPLELISKLCEMCEERLKEEKNPVEKTKLQYLVDDCNMWLDEDEEIDVEKQ